MNMKETKYIREIRNGNIDAFEKVFRLYYENLCLYANQYLKDLDLSEEAVQDVFFNIWMKRQQIHITDSLKSYLYAATRNKCLKIIRSQNQADKYSDYIKSRQVQQTHTPMHELTAKELNLIIERTLNSSPGRTGEIFRMSRFQNLKYEEIARRLSISVKTVESNMGKALKIFRKNLNEYLHVG